MWTKSGPVGALWERENSKNSNSAFELGPYLNPKQEPPATKEKWTLSPQNQNNYVEKGKDPSYKSIPELPGFRTTSSFTLISHQDSPNCDPTALLLLTGKPSNAGRTLPASAVAAPCDPTATLLPSSTPGLSILHPAVTVRSHMAPACHDLLSRSL